MWPNRKLVLALITAFWLLPTLALAGVDRVLVVKSERKLYLIGNDTTVREYDVSLGGSPKGHKRAEGDEKTPEGHYILDYRKADSSFYRAIHISYPNNQDKEAARKLGVSPGGLIMIHGQKNGLGWLSWASQWFDWTDGCIAVTNSEMEEIWELVEVGTPIEIRW